MTIAIDRTAPEPPPENPEAEASMLGAVLLDPAAFEEVRSHRIDAADLSREQHRIVLRAMQRIVSRGDTIGFQTVHAELGSAGDLDAIGGPQFLVALMQRVPTVTHAGTYAAIVERTGILRRLIRAANDIGRIALTRDDPEDAVREAQQVLFALSEGSLHRDIVPLDEALRAYTDHLAQLRERDESIGVPTGLRTLDEKTGGLQPSDLILLAGRPGLGKTSLALCFIEHAALRAGKTCAIFSMEMSEMQIVQRLISMNAEIDGNRIRRGRLSMDELSLISRASERLQQAPIYIEESTRLSVTDILAKSRRLQAERGLDLVVIDYLQLIEGAGDDENRVQEVAQISRALKSIARELQVPLVALSQLSRQIETRGTEPTLSDLRECVTGDTRIVDAATGKWVPVRDAHPGMRILSLDERDQKIKTFALDDAWSTGVKPVFTVTTQTGRQIRATANHPFLTARGWLRLEQLRADDLLATARRLPAHGAVHFDTVSRALAKSVQALLLRLGVVASTAPGVLDAYGTMPLGPTAAHWADRTGEEVLRTYAQSDVLWETIRSIEPAGEEEVFDLRVPGAGNFLANGIVVHNSGALEADADLVMFLWQKDVNDKRDRVTRLKLAKHRNGPTADMELLFENELTRFRDLGETKVEV